jgi:hypothetical protein
VRGGLGRLAVKPPCVSQPAMTWADTLTSKRDKGTPTDAGAPSPIRLSAASLDRGLDVDQCALTTLMNVPQLPSTARGLLGIISSPITMWPAPSELAAE